MGAASLMIHCPRRRAFPFQVADDRQKVHNRFVMMTFVLIKLHTNTPEAMDTHDDFLAAWRGAILESESGRRKWNLRATWHPVSQKMGKSALGSLRTEPTAE